MEMEIIYVGQINWSAFESILPRNNIVGETESTREEGGRGGGEREIGNNMRMRDREKMEERGKITVGREIERCK